MIKPLHRFFFCILFLTCYSFHAEAQRGVISDFDEVVKKAALEIDSSMQAGFLHEMAVKHSLKGEYVMNVTIHEKGKVLSVFVVKSNAVDVQEQNFVKDLIRQMEFSFKMPKGRMYKFEHTFRFS